MKKTLATIGKLMFFLGLGLFFIWLFVRNLTPGEKAEIWESLRQANYLWILLSLLIGIVSHISRSIRWRMLLEPMGYHPRFSNVVFAVFIGYFANLALPRLGEVSRCGVLAKYEKIPFQKSFGTVVTERAIDLLIFALLFILNLVIQFGRVSNYIAEKIIHPIQGKLALFDGTHYLIYLLIAGVVFFLALLYFLRKHFNHTGIYRKIKEVIMGFLEGLKSLAHIKKPFWFIFHSLFIWTLYYAMTMVVFNCLPETKGISLTAGFAVYIFATIGVMIVQGGIGIYPAIVAETLFLYDIPETKGYAMGWLLWSGQTVMIILAGIISLILLPLMNKTLYGKDRPHPVQNS
ncbi:MAG TPA: lysylphosphatidylglycerol synthase transmembrane domain-containing protein [Bacteroidales bacterium]|nr:lysylphosphatidylglycerol synthase transmembrane domain-containing protein [Bacteroidales bacterium]HNS47846.1 lysylphosphatidylglycerol synthase transmembrane domain-containing protein [Bacteroidales bacterium]